MGALSSSFLNAPANERADVVDCALQRSAEPILKKIWGELHGPILEIVQPKLNRGEMLDDLREPLRVMIASTISKLFHDAIPDELRSDFVTAKVEHFSSTEAKKTFDFWFGSACAGNLARSAPDLGRQAEDTHTPAQIRQCPGFGSGDRHT